MITLWLAGLFRTRTARISGTMAGVALTVALLAVLGAFLQSSTSSMTERAIAGVAVDWQVLLVPGADRSAIENAATQAGPASSILPVGYADATALTSTTGGTEQTTGAGKVLGLPDGYLSTFPGEARLLLGSADGALIAQQTAANLHAGVGDAVAIRRDGVPDATVTVSGVVELPRADSLFQAIGVPPGSAPQAPPDNVLLLPAALWHTVFDAQAAADPASVRSELHVKLDRSGLPGDPVAASIEAGRRGRNFEARTAGAAILADNLAARLDAARQDALYAKVLFLFLGAPGAILAALLTIAIARTGLDRQRRDQALLRLRGASVGATLRIAAAETGAIGVGGALAGLAIAWVTSKVLFGVGFQDAWRSAAAAAGAGLLLALFAVLGPAWASARGLTVAAARQNVARRSGPPLWSRTGLDVILLVLGGLSYWRSAASGYQVVVAPEGVAATAVNYTAFLAPVLIWTGLGLLTLRLVDLALRRCRGVVARAIRPIAVGLERFVAAAFAHETRRLTAGIALTALAFAFAASTAIFNTTYEAQAQVDAELTNGADVTITGTTGHPASEVAATVAALPGVAAVQPMQHRYAYVGSDLQDLYGIDPTGIGDATAMTDAYFANRDAAGTLDDLRRTPDGVLVSQETVNDYQLAKGDTINLRLQSAADHEYHVVPFTIIGVVLEFPTAPKDSFLVANADYVAAATRDAGAEILLVRATGTADALASAVRRAVGTTAGVKVSSISDAVHVIGSSLTAIDLGGLTRLELGFALIAIAAAAGLMLALGFAERRRSHAILAALGARPSQIGAFIWSEAVLTLAAGAAIGLPAGWLLAEVLVKLLTGVFDPPPEALAVPWGYLAAILAAAAIAVGIAARIAVVASGRDVAEAMRTDR